MVGEENKYALLKAFGDGDDDVVDVPEDDEDDLDEDDEVDEEEDVKDDSDAAPES
jgi:hypothetical protein